MPARNSPKMAGGGGHSGGSDAGPADTGTRTADTPDETRTADTPDETRDRAHESRLEYVALGLAILVATVHIANPTRGLPRLIAVVGADPELLLSDPRPLLLTLSGFAVVFGINAAIVGVRRRPLYALGVVLMATHLVGYAVWHLTGHGGILPGRAAQYHSIEILVDEITRDGWVLVSKVTEGALLAVLAVRYRRSAEAADTP